LTVLSTWSHHGFEEEVNRMFSWSPHQAPALFEDRREAGRELADRLACFKPERPIILALPRGGVTVAFEIASALSAPLEVIVTRKIGLPQNPEFGIGAIGEAGVLLLDEPVIKLTGLPSDELEQVVKSEEKELQRRVALYRENRPLPDLCDRTVIIVDDGLATGVTAKAAIQVVKKLQAGKIIFAAPICSYETAHDLSDRVDDVVCLASPVEMMAIGIWYRDFEQVSDEEVLDLLERSQSQLNASIWSSKSGGEHSQRHER
jgi:putative phosphoribosyl transferase